MAEDVKIKIDINSGVLEVEAPLSAVEGLLQRLEQFLPNLAQVRGGRPHKPESAPVAQRRQTSEKPVADESEPTVPVRKASRAPRKEVGELRILPNLNLRPNGKQSLRAFYEEKDPKSNERGFAVIVYYLKRILEVETVTLNHVYTALKDVGLKVPTRLPTVLSNSARRHGWIDTRTKDDIKITIHGENFVEHDLPPKSAAKSNK